MPNGPNLRGRALTGAAYLSARQALGIGIRLVGVLLVTRLIGPTDFGIYAGAVAIVALLALVAQMGAELFLIRQQDEPDTETYDAVFSFLVVTASVTTAIALAASFVVQSIASDDDFIAPFQVLVLTIPMSVLWAPAQAKLERAFSFGRIAALEVGVDAALYGTAVALALTGAGIWAPIAGHFVAYGWLAVASYALASHRPRWRWSRPLVRKLLRYGLEFAPAGLLNRAEYLVNPLVVGPTLGAASVGYVALVLRIVETLNFVLRATWRLSIVALSKVQDDLVRLRRGFEEGMALQVLVLGPILAGFGLAAPWLIPFLFGDPWTPAVDLYPFVAFSSLLGAVFSMHGATLYVLGRNLVMTAISGLRLALLVIAAVIFVPLFDLTGYGLAMILPWAAVLIAERKLRPVIRYRYDMTLRWLVLFTPALFAPLVPRPWSLLLALPALAILLDKTARRQVAQYGGLARAAIFNRPAPPAGVTPEP